MKTKVLMSRDYKKIARNMLIDKVIDQMAMRHESFVIHIAKREAKNIIDSYFKKMAVEGRTSMNKKERLITFEINMLVDEIPWILREEGLTEDHPSGKDNFTLSEIGREAKRMKGYSSYLKVKRRKKFLKNFEKGFTTWIFPILSVYGAFASTVANCNHPEQKSKMPVDSIRHRTPPPPPNIADSNTIDSL
ncbi:hypothetical protein QTN47_16990 [Danxiaibacter flavus]|uniref:Uncharacterized protein n=1 Tax=Danxiaibacter flavus TaxID=3049108 RepID=A0ABV3ZKY0_9BACT|nr:hypothetical protein QNM32_17000 [Chitinophagaceae bacterium DXS]